MPVLPFIEDNQNNILAILEQAKECGASYILPSFGVTLRDRQRNFFYDKLDTHFPGVREEYERKFGNRYFAPVNDSDSLSRYFSDLCLPNNIAMRIQKKSSETANQLRLF